VKPKPAAKPLPRPVPKSAPKARKKTKPAPRLKVTSDPSGATVSLNGETVGKTPYSVTFKGQGPFVLKVRAEAFKTWVRRFEGPAEVRRQGKSVMARLEMDL
jgi:hypothetical protein